MIICSCNVLSDGDIKACLRPGPGCPRTTADVYRCFGCGPKCGRCVRTIRALMNEAVREAHNECGTSCEAHCPKPLLTGRQPLPRPVETAAAATDAAIASADEIVAPQAPERHASEPLAFAGHA